LIDWEAENQFTHQPNGAQQICMDVAGQPGYMALLSVTKVVDEHPPDAWPKAWMIAPISGIVWGVGFSIYAFLLSKLGETLAQCMKRPNSNHMA
jgi:hypothetical protein